MKIEITIGKNLSVDELAKVLKKASRLASELGGEARVING